MFKVTKNSCGIKYDLITGFETENEAVDFADSMDWVFYDENEFQWFLDVDEYE